jgi:hypothetical protein
MSEAAAVDLTALSDEELEQEGFRLGRERAAAEAHWRDLQMQVQAEVTRRSDARGGAAPRPTEEG